MNEQNNTANNKENTQIYLEQAIKLIPGNFFIKDPQSVYICCNSNFATTAGLSNPNDIVGKTDFDLPWTKTEAEKFIADDQEVLAGKSLLNHEETLTKSDGTTATVMVSKISLHNSQGETIGLLGSFVDLSAIKEQERELIAAREEARAANDAKTALITSISHDLRTPLTTIICVAELLKKRDADQQFTQLLDNVISAGAIITSILDEILTYSRLTKTSIQFQHETVDLRQLLADALNSHNYDASNKNLTLTLDYNKNIPQQIYSDEVALRRIFSNLISNAVKFTNEGSVTVQVSAHELSPQQYHFDIKITDTGIGISKQHLPKLFDDFYRAEAAYNRKYQGIGLGLTICKQLLNQLSGSISIESTPQVGTEFHIQLPLRIESSTINTPTDTVCTPAPKQNNQLLLVEDNALTRETLEVALSDMGYNVVSTSSGLEAIRLLKDQDFDYAMIDIGLPDITGLEIIIQTRSMDTHFIAISGHVAEHDKHVLLKAGFNQFLSKPITLAKLNSIFNTG